MDSHRRLRTWQLARRLVGVAYKITKRLPNEEKYGVSAQLRRAAWSVQNNIAEGNAKLGRREMRRFLDISIGSLAEVDSMLSTLPDVYSVDKTLIQRGLRLRKAINGGIFAMLKRRKR